MRTDWTPLDSETGTGNAPDSDVRGPLGLDFAHAHTGRSRNGLPEPNYAWRPGDHERDDWVRAQVAAAKKRAQARKKGPRT